MRSMSRIVASAAAVAGALALGGLIQPAVAQTNQDYSTMPGYSAHPEGMCWTRAFGSGNENNGYWARCKNESQASSSNAQAQAQQQTSRRSRARHR
jgi:ABC-type sugar transport system substrate-binding protein